MFISFTKVYSTRSQNARNKIIHYFTQFYYQQYFLSVNIFFKEEKLIVRETIESKMINVGKVFISRSLYCLKVIFKVELKKKYQSNLLKKVFI